MAVLLLVLGVLIGRPLLPSLHLRAPTREQVRYILAVLSHQQQAW